MNKGFSTIVLVLLLVFLTSCVKKLNELRVVSDKTEFNMLIAGDSSEFKDIIRNRVVGHYKELFSIHVVNIKTLKSSDTHDYDLVLIMDTCMAWSRLNPSIKSFMKQSENRKKTVLFMTAGDPDWTYSYKDVDAITSASVVENEDIVFNRIINQIDGIIKR